MAPPLSTSPGRLVSIVAPLKIGKSTTLQVGADVHAIGHPTDRVAERKTPAACKSKTVDRKPTKNPKGVAYLLDTD